MAKWGIANYQNKNYVTRWNGAKAELFDGPDVFSPGKFIQSVPADQVAPRVPLPIRKLIAVGLNYKAHIAEFGKQIPDAPVTWLKSTESVIGPGETVILAHPNNRTDLEVELAVVIGREGKNIPVEDWRNYVFGFTIGNDISDRHIQKQDGQFYRAKSYDTYCPLGPWIETEGNFEDALLESLIDGESKQSGRTSEMIFNLPHLIAFCSHHTTLRKGDVILTGTPSGVSALKPGQTIECRIQGIGSLVNPVKASPPESGLPVTA